MKLNLLITSILSLSLYTAVAQGISAHPAKLSTISSPNCMATIDAKTPLTTAAVDYYWDNRENITCQNNLINYLIKKPVLASDKDYALAWKTARLIYFVGNFGVGEKAFAENGSKRKSAVKLFDYGVNAGSLAMKLQSSKVDGYYWYAVNLGSYGLAKGIIAAASNASSGMDALKKVIQLDDSYEVYGAYRILGRYYHALPGIFGGSDAKALSLLRSATQKASANKVNWVYLGNYYYDREEYAKALDACNKALKTPDLPGEFENRRYISEANICVFKATNKLNKKG